MPAPDGNFYPRHSKLRPAAPKEDAEKAHLAANPELLGEATIRELEERRAVGFQLTASEEEELRDLRERYPEYAEFGLSMHAETRRGTETRSVLMDFGFTPEALINNTNLLGIDPAGLDDYF